MVDSVDSAGKEVTEGVVEEVYLAQEKVQV